MLPSLLVAVFMASSVASDDFFMSYMPNDTTGSYEPLFVACGSSCSDCGNGATRCFADSFSNLCYEPERGETCCRDKLGTSCYDGYYCAYDEDNVGFCCAEDDEEEDCAKALNVTLKSPDDPQEVSTTVSVTAVFSPSVTASDQTIVHRPDRTHLSLLPGTSRGGDDDPEDLQVDKDVSMAVKIGAAIGGFVGAAILVTLVVMWVLHRRNVSKYAKLGDMKSKDGMHASHPHHEQHSMHVMPHMMPGAHPRYEPMRSHPPHDPQASWAGSPAISREPSPHLPHDVAYSNHPAHSPAASHHNIELTHIPPMASPDAFGQNHHG